MITWKHKFDQSTLETYKAEAKQRWGKTEAFAEYTEKSKSRSPEADRTLAAGMDEVFGAFARCMQAGAQPGSDQAQSLVKTLQDHITEHFYTCTKEILSGLGQMYTADERFRHNIDRQGPGTAEFVSEAIRIYCG